MIAAAFLLPEVSVQGKAASMSHLPTTAAAAVHDVTPHGSPGAHHVLIADNDEHSRDRRAAQLRASGYHVTTARTGFETIVKACCHLPDLILLDDSLGNSEVVETGRRLGSCPVTAHLPIVRLGSGRRLPPRVLPRRQQRASV